MLLDIYKKIGNYLIYAILILGSVLSFTYANSDIYIQHITIQHTYVINGQTGIIQGTTPRMNVSIGNNGPDDVEYQTTGTGFLTCTRGGQTVYNAPYIGNLYIATSGFWTRSNLSLNPILTETLTTKTIQCQVNPSIAGIVDPQIANNSISITFGVFEPPSGRFDLVLNRAIESIQENIDPAESALGTEGFINFIRKNIAEIVIPIVVILGVILAIVGFYKMMVSEEAETKKEGIKYVLRGTIGIIIMMSARYIANTVLFEAIGNYGNIQDLEGIQVAKILYEQGAYPFIKIMIYLSVGVLFLILTVRVINYLTNPSEEIKKQAISTITRSTVGIIIILGAKQIVEAIVGSEQQIIQQPVQNVGSIGDSILSNNIPLLYTIINRIMGLTTFIIIVLIIIQTYQLLVNPTSEDNINRIKRSLLYIALGILVIGAGYVITNVLIIN